MGKQENDAENSKNYFKGQSADVRKAANMNGNKQGTEGATTKGGKE